MCRWLCIAAFLLISLALSACHPSSTRDERGKQGVDLSARCGDGVISESEECDSGGEEGAVGPGDCSITCDRAPSANAFPELRVVYLHPSLTKVYRVADYQSTEIKDDFIEAQIGYLGDDEWQLKIKFVCDGEACKQDTIIEALFFPSMTTRYFLSGCDGTPKNPVSLQTCASNSECSGGVCVWREPSETGGVNGEQGICGVCNDTTPCQQPGTICDASGQCVNECIAELAYYYPLGPGTRIPAKDWNLDFMWEDYSDFTYSTRRYDNPFSRLSYFARTHSGGATMPFAIMADGVRSLIVLASNWPPKDVVPAISAQRLELGYFSDGTTSTGVNYYSMFRSQMGWDINVSYGSVPQKGEGPQTYKAIISEQKVGEESTSGAEPWHLAVDVYRKWLTAHMPEVPYPLWTKQDNIILTASLPSHDTPAKLKSLVEQMDEHRDAVPWAVFWGKGAPCPARTLGDQAMPENGYCWHLSEDNMDMNFRLNGRLLVPLDGDPKSFNDYMNDFRNQGMHIGYYTSPAPTWERRVEYRLDQKGYPYLSDFIDRTLDDYNSNALYVDVLASHVGPVKEVMQLFDTDIFPEEVFGSRKDPIIPVYSMMEGSIDVFPGIYMSDGFLNNSSLIRQFNHGASHGEESALVCDAQTCELSMRGCHLAAAYPEAVPAHACSGMNRTKAFPELMAYALPHRLWTLGHLNNSSIYAFKNSTHTLWNSLGQRLSFLLGAHNSLYTLTASHFKFIDRLRELVDWADPSNSSQKPRFMDRIGIDVRGNGTNAFYAYKFVREGGSSDGELLLTVDDWDGGGGVIQGDGFRVDIPALSGGKGQMCIVKITDGSQEKHCCVVTPRPKSAELNGVQLTYTAYDVTCP